MKPLPINKQTHIEPGKQIKIVLASAYDQKYKEVAKLIIPGSVHIITERPSRKARRNGDMGVWVEGTDGEKVFVRMFGWIPYFAPKPMQRTKQNFTRNKYPSCKRTK
ncbi:MAG: hypothetical protein WC827_03645 [Candidatus Paceibacterota bacterium]|jgi:hypothetical protein